MNRSQFLLAIVLAVFVSATGAEPIRFICENWHPRLGQVDDLAFPIDSQQQICNGQKCKVTESELAWSEQGGRYEYVMNRQSGEGHIYFSASAEKTALLKNCRPAAKLS